MFDENGTSYASASVFGCRNVLQVWLATVTLIFCGGGCRTDYAVSVDTLAPRKTRSEHLLPRSPSQKSGLGDFPVARYVFVAY